MSIDITPLNKKGQRHGYWETYWSDDDDDVCYKCFYHNGKLVGYDEDYWDIGELVKKGYHI
jgi:hypothetical protein